MLVAVRDSALQLTAIKFAFYLITYVLNISSKLLEHGITAAHLISDRTCKVNLMMLG